MAFENKATILGQPLQLTTSGLCPADLIKDECVELEECHRKPIQGRFHVFDDFHALRITKVLVLEASTSKPYFIRFQGWQRQLRETYMPSAPVDSLAMMRSFSSTDTRPDKSVRSLTARST